MKYIFATIATAVLAASPAYAAEDTGLYMGAGIGNFAVDSDLIYNGKNFEGSDFAYKFFGGYQFMKWLAVEVEYFDGGEPTDVYRNPSFPNDRFRLGTSVTGWVGSAVGIWPINESFNVFGKLGFVYWDAGGSGKVRDDEGTIVKASVNEDGTDFAWGVGGTWNFSEAFGVRAEYQGFELDNFNSVDLASASIVWRF
jgi:OOP family OmpA-OmpF porin